MSAVHRNAESAQTPHHAQRAIVVHGQNQNRRRSVAQLHKLHLRWNGRGSNLIRADLAREIDVVHVTENELQISKLTAPSQILDASTDDKCIVRGTSPTLDQAAGVVIVGNEAGSDQAGRNP